MLGILMPTFVYNRQTLAYDKVGDGPAIIFQHGLSADRQQALAALSAIEGYTVIAMDMPGHGDSPGTKGAYGFDKFVDCVIALMGYLSIERATLGGISMGSGIALGVALREPSRVQSLLLVRPAWLSTGDPANLAIISSMGHWIEQGGLEFAQEKLQGDPIYREALKANPACALSLGGAFVRPQAEESASVLYEMVSDCPIASLDDLARVKHSTVVIGNEGDPLHPHSMAETLAGAIPHARLETISSRYLAAEKHQQDLTRVLQGFMDEQQL